ncbi:MAG: TonB-dependent receptor, partial [Candidatus Aminicenantes bacterium]|nr:TonB-dependent receptor [Candidatus Aminicenantes bacterium]
MLKGKNNIRSVIFLIFIVLLLFGTLSATEKIRGQVLSINGIPINRAEVKVENQELFTLTDEKGYFELELPQEDKKIIIKIKHPDYFEEEFVINTTQGKKVLQFMLVPFVRQTEEVVVTATRFPEPLLELPVSGSVISKLTVEEKLPPHVTEVVSLSTGVTSLGSGGFSIVPSIRGLARRRVLLLIDNSRISSDRRTGPNASFLNPQDLEKIEIFRSPSSVFYGSDAMGGVINLLTYTPPAENHLKLKGHLKYGSVNNEREFNLAISGARSGWAYYFSVRNDQADNYKSPQGEIPYSYFSQSSLMGKVVRYSEKREITTSFILARGRDIGKPAVNSLTKPTWYPRENQNLFQFNWKEKSLGEKVELVIHFYLNPNFLETRKDSIKNGLKTQESFARTESTDYGAQLSLEYKLSNTFRLISGADFYARARSKALNQYKTLDSTGQVTEITTEYPYLNGNRKDAGLFLSFDYLGIRKLDLTGGLRLDFLKSSAETGGQLLASDKTTLTGFLAASYRLLDSLNIFANFSRSYRAPDINERFYTGITGRGFIIANPGLKNEDGLNFESGFRFSQKRTFLGLYLFQYSIDNLIERYKIGDQLYTYENVDNGRIKGLEVEWEWFPIKGFSLFGNYYLYQGKSKISGNPLNDIPPQRLIIGSRIWWNRFSMELTG